MDPIAWPASLVPANVKLSLQSSSRGGGQTIEGNEQVVTSPGAQRWALTFSGLAIRTADQIRALRAIEAQLDGRANVVLLPIYDRARTRGGSADTSWDDGATWDDGTLWTQPSDNIAATLAADAAVNAVSLNIASLAAAPIPGQHFSLGSRLYRVQSVTASGDFAGTITIRPWLREAAAAGAALDFTNPVGRFRLVKDDGLAADLQLWRFASLTVDFIEA